MVKKLLVVLLVCNCPFIYAQTIKTDVLVIGGTESGMAAAIQCARSKIKTVLAGQFPKSDSGRINEAPVTVYTHRNLPSGIWGEFRQRVHEFYKGQKGYDTAYNSPLKFEPYTGAAILKKITDTVKNLTVYENSSFTGIKKDGDRWNVSVSQNGKTILFKVRVVVDATKTGEVAAKLNGQVNTGNSVAIESEYRTSIATGYATEGQLFNDAGFVKTAYPALPSYSIPIASVIVKGQDNLLITERLLPVNNDIQYLPIRLTLGQGTGTIAAYCAFFKTTTKNLNVRTIQGELLDFKGYLLPFADITPRNRDWRAIQQIGATGLLRGVQKENGKTGDLFFIPDSTVLTSEIKPVLDEIYSRAFLWFNREKPGEKFTVGNLLSLISEMTLTDPQTLKITLQKAWKTQYKFTLNFDLNRPATRREFAVLTNKFINPFARKVDLAGRLVN
jgi:hypothetical protein